MGALRIVATDRHRLHDRISPEWVEGHFVPTPEVPARAERILDALRVAALAPVEEPAAWDDAHLAAVHTARYLRFLSSAFDRWRAAGFTDPEAVPYIRGVPGAPADVEPDHVIGQLGFYSFDDVAIGEHTWVAARAAVDVALTAWSHVADHGTRLAYALCRPPGHHATAEAAGGYCYLNNTAVVAEAWARRGARVAVVDVDYHHGNGTQSIFWSRGDVLTVSLHCDPAHEYPYFVGHAHETGAGAGTGANRNLPLPPGTDWTGYEPALAEAVATVRAWGADALVVALGVDTAAEDPDRFLLDADAYPRLGAALAALDRPTVVVQEGGYSLEVIGRNVVGVLRGLLDG